MEETCTQCAQNQGAIITVTAIHPDPEEGIYVVYAARVQLFPNVPSTENLKTWLTDLAADLIEKAEDEAHLLIHVTPLCLRCGASAMETVSSLINIEAVGEAVREIGESAVEALALIVCTKFKMEVELSIASTFIQEACVSARLSQMAGNLKTEAIH